MADVSISGQNEMSELQQTHQENEATESSYDSSPKKRRKDENSEETLKQIKMERLENRLGGILCCAVCLDLPTSAVYQCTNGHLMCVGCFNHLLADARMRDETSTCPNCRTEISKTLSSRNLAVEKAVSELPASCVFCSREFPRNVLEKHQKELCEERTIFCKYSRIGCQWRGPYHESEAHHATCIHPNRSGGQLLEYLVSQDAGRDEEKKLYSTLFDLLSFEKIAFNDVQLKPYRTDEFIHKLYYETSRFYTFSHQWVVKARINGDLKDPTQRADRSMSYQLILKSKPANPMTFYFFLLRGPFGDMDLELKIYQHEFSESSYESPMLPLPLPDSEECNKVLSAKAINCRLIMFMCPK